MINLNFFHKHNFLGTTQDLPGFQTLHANGMCWEVDAHIFFLNFRYLKKTHKIQFLYKHDFSRFVNGQNFRLCMQRMCWDWEVTAHIFLFLHYFFSHKNIHKIQFLHRQKFSSAASLQPDSCDPYSLYETFLSGISNLVHRAKYKPNFTATVCSCFPLTVC